MKVVVEISYDVPQKPKEVADVQNYNNQLEYPNEELNQHQVRYLDMVVESKLTGTEVVLLLYYLVQPLFVQGFNLLHDLAYVKNF